MNIPKKIAVLFSGLGLVIAGAAGTIAMQTHAQTATTTTNPTTAAAASTSASGSTAATTKPQGHAPLGNDGNITAISGTTITMQEEADEGGASYTVDASKAAFTNNGAASSIADLKVGSKIFVQGTVSGTGVTATSVSLGHPGFGGHGRGMMDPTDTTTQPAQQ